MYTAFFGFKENPFNLTPDPRYLYLSRYHREALDHLLYGINERRGFIAITGGIGTGKTTLCRALLDHLDPNTKSALIFSSFISDMEILQTINQEFGIQMGPDAKSKKDYVDALNQFLLGIFREGGNALLLIDEAQNLSHTVLEQIRMLSNLETEKDKLIQVVLVGQSELKGILSAPSLRQLNERITVRYDLKPVDAADLRGYVSHRLSVAGGGGALNFTAGAFTAIYAYSRGNPRRINAVCDRALLIAYADETQTITRRTIRKAITDLSGGAATGQLPERRSKQGVGPLTIALLLLLVITAGLAGWSLQREFVPSPEPMTVPAPVIPTEKKVEDLFLDEVSSFTGLFDLFRVDGQLRQGRAYGPNGKGRADMGDLNLGLVSLSMAPEYFRLLKKPFRVTVAGPLPTSLAQPRYLLIRETSDRGAIALDHEGRPRQLTRDFILKRWGGKVSFLHPYDERDRRLNKGMTSPEVLKVQRILNRVGYPVEQSGVFEEQTFREVVRFQKDFGLSADGIIGPRTLALLFQMTE
ncbi:MAG: family ATPase [Thermodesulfobacteriota bacterium]|nr:family ATPase [Thermodesulfobacteriota bacterium]